MSTSRQRPGCTSDGHSGVVVSLPTIVNDGSSRPVDTHIAALKRSMQNLLDAVAVGESSGELSFWDLVAVAQEFEEVLQLRNLFDLHLVGELLSPAGISQSGTRSATRFLVDRLGISPRDALERVRAVELDGDCEPDDSKESLSPEAAATAPEQQEPTGEELAAEWAYQKQLQEQRARNAAAAWNATATGDLDSQKRATIFNQLRNLLPKGPKTAEDIKEEVYGELDSLTHTEVKARVKELVDESNEAIRNPADMFADQRRRNLYVSKPDKDGCSTIRGTLDAATSTILTKLMNSYAKSGYGTPVDAKDDKRTYGQLGADAMGKILRDALTQYNKGSSGRAGLASIVVVADAADFAPNDKGPNPWWAPKFLTNVGLSLNAAQVLRLGVTDNMLLSLIDTRDGMAPIDLALYSGNRLADFYQRVALQIIDGGCAHPGCDEPMDKCDIHHIVAFIAGGRTDIENLVPLCRVHHSQNDDTWCTPHRNHMEPRTKETNYKSGSVHVDSDGTSHPPEYNTGPTARKAPGYVPPPGTETPPKPRESKYSFLPWVEVDLPDHLLPEPPDEWFAEQEFWDDDMWDLDWEDEMFPAM